MSAGTMTEVRGLDVPANEGNRSEPRLITVVIHATINLPRTKTRNRVTISSNATPLTPHKTTKNFDNSRHGPQLMATETTEITSNSPLNRQELKMPTLLAINPVI